MPILSTVRSRLIVWLAVLGAVPAVVAVAAGAGGRARSPVLLRTRSGQSITVHFEGEARHATGVRVEGEARLVYVGQLTEESVAGKQR